MENLKNQYNCSFLTATNGTWKKVGFFPTQCLVGTHRLQYADPTGLQQKAAAFADAVLIPLAEFFQVVNPG